MKRIVLFVEGEGEADAAPRLVKLLLTEQNAWDAVFLAEKDTFRVGHINKLVKDDCREWKRFLKAGLKLSKMGGVLLLLDGDIKKVGSDEFCSADVAKSLAGNAAEVGGGHTFSVAVVFAIKEFESWLIAGIESLAGKKLPDGRTIHPNAKAPEGNVEESPRDAKGWFNKIVEGGYKPTRDQAPLTDLVDLDSIRAANLRSFKRLESAISELVSAIRNDKHAVTPSGTRADCREEIEK